jgi:hypothetical protein
MIESHIRSVLAKIQLEQSLSVDTMNTQRHLNSYQYEAANLDQIQREYSLTNLR